MQTSANGTLKTTFRLMLENEWRFKPRCNLQGHSACGCLKPFIKTGLLVSWMRDVKLSKSNGELLLEEINPIKTPLHSSASTILNDSILVFSLLIKEKHGRLIHIFHRAGFDDVKLRNTKHSMLDDKDLRHAHTKHSMGYPSTFEKLVEDLESSRWEFFPHFLGPKLENKEFGNKLYIPFCRQEAVTQLGATAVVYVAIIQEYFVADEVRAYLGPLIDGESYGPCYRLAINRISDTRWNEYIQERRAFKGIRDKKGILRCLGSYNFVDNQGKTHYNILLEFADLNLHEFFMDFDPPQLAEEVNSQWAELCEIASAIETLHNFEYDGARWLGWHGDIKPRNLLRVGKEWKLADYGFTVFEAESLDYSPRTLLKECTQTWGAPETVHQGATVLQTVDTWSYGCVLSIIATWMVKGVKGVIEYQEYRSQDRPSDAFHNDGDVLPQIRIWHDHLKQIIRQSDHITGPILDVVDKHLLLRDPQARFKSAELKAILSNILAGARRPYQSPVDMGLIKALRDVQGHPMELMATYKIGRDSTTRQTVFPGTHRPKVNKSTITEIARKPQYMVLQLWGEQRDESNHRPTY
ncbi:hypothetical protein KCU91_g7231, partial [Aureobasidium melanogenum]